MRPDQLLRVGLAISLALGAWITVAVLGRPQERLISQQALASSQVAAEPTLEETLKWLAEKVEGAGYHYCQFQGKNLVWETVRYESVEAKDCKLLFTFVWEMSSAQGQPFSKGSKDTLSLRGSTQDISVSSSVHRCGKPCRGDYGDREIFFVGRPKVAGVYFASRELADRTARAMNHAIDLCGKEPF